MSTSKTYECMILLDNREVKSGWQALKDQVAGLFNKHGAEVVSSRRWDERRLAYPINRQNRATYLLAYCNASTSQVAGIRRDLQFNEAVLRSMMLAVEQVPEEAFQPEEAFDESAVQVEEVTEVTIPQPAAEAKPAAPEEAPAASEAKPAAPEEAPAASDAAPAPETGEKSEPAADAAPAAEASEESAPAADAEPATPAKSEGEGEPATTSDENKES